MPLNQSTTEEGRPVSGKRTLQQLRREAGFRSGKEFADHLGIPAPTYARYERVADGPEEAIPMKAAWRIADALGCSIDLVVGREPDEGDASRIQRMYNALTPGSRERLDEYLDFIEYREHVMSQQRRWE